jgi:hypothetical protein
LLSPGVPGPRFDEIEADLAGLGELRGKPGGTIRIAAGRLRRRPPRWSKRCASAVQVADFGKPAGTPDRDIDYLDLAAVPHFSSQRMLNHCQL